MKSERGELFIMLICGIVIGLLFGFIAGVSINEVETKTSMPKGCDLCMSSEAYNKWCDKGLECEETPCDCHKDGCFAWCIKCSSYSEKLE